MGKLAGGMHSWSIVDLLLVTMAVTICLLVLCACVVLRGKKSEEEMT
jgi:hypothetical protein